VGTTAIQRADDSGVFADTDRQSQPDPSGPLSIVAGIYVDDGKAANAAGESS